MPDISQFFNAKILIIDDEEFNIELLEAFLKQAGYKNILSTSDPTITPDLYREYKPDLVLLDLNMPVMDGFAVMAELRNLEKESYLPVMVLSANTDEGSRVNALNAGAKDFLNKPFSGTEVMTRIRNMLEVRLLHKKLCHQKENLEEQIAVRTKQLRDSQLEIVQRLGLASEFRDNETGQHIIRMSYYSKLLAQQYGLSSQECELILNASPMHDIGKLGIPDSILLKPGKLTREEFEIMKTHTTIGSQLLEDGKSDIMDAARTIALNHHEKWDGTGYPNSIAGENIPIYGRIVAIADVFDALTSVRPYKAAWSVEDAYIEIKRLSGTYFDPELVNHFSRIFPDILEIKSMYADEDESDNLLFGSA